MSEIGPYRPVVLIVLDGWGESSCQVGNAIAAARTPNLDRWRDRYPASTLGAAGGDVGLKAGQMGDSNVGHLNLGAGRIVYQDAVRIDQAVAAGTLGSQPAIVKLLTHVQARDATLHLLGLLSDGGVHSHLGHLRSLLAAAAARGVARVRVHAFLDGRDVLPRSAASYLTILQAELSAYAARGKDWALASLAGRYYAMDRDNRWERTQQAYLAIVGGGECPCTTSWQEAIAEAYARGESDEFIKPVSLLPDGGMADGDGVLLFNFRADRGRQLARALVEPDQSFGGFARPAGRRKLLVVTMTRYDRQLPVEAAFGPADLDNTLGEVVARAGRRQLRLAETEKYAHVTYFFSGGREQPFAGEDRILVPSPAVATYDLWPEMSAAQVTRQAVAALESSTYDLLVVNYANGDMVGHSGHLPAAVKAVEAVDALLEQVVNAVIAAGGAALVVSDHGNAETMASCTDGSPYTAHTSNRVPSLLVAGGLPPGTTLRPGILADVAPTVLELLGLPAPAEMTGSSLLIRAQSDTLQTDNGQAVRENPRRCSYAHPV